MDDDSRDAEMLRRWRERFANRPWFTAVEVTAALNALVDAREHPEAHAQLMEAVREETKEDGTCTFAIRDDFVDMIGQLFPDATERVAWYKEPLPADMREWANSRPRFK